MRRIVPVAKEGWPLMAAPALAGGAAMVFGWHLAGALVLVAAFGMALFFRDPRRVAPDSPAAVICPADGKVVSVEEVEERDYAGGRTTRISIFMSLFDVHINYAPISGRVEYIKYRKGAFHRANLPEASLHNENNSIGIMGEKDGVMVRQVAGKVARRIVCKVKVNDLVRAGERIGLIKFGSRVEVFVPVEWEVLVREGERVKGGISRIARLR